MKIITNVADRLLELLAPQATAAAEDCVIIGRCDRDHFRMSCSTPTGGAVRCVYAFGGCSLPGGGG
jgi:hypothetical protein